MKTRTVLPALTISMALVASSGFAQDSQSNQNQSQRSGGHQSDVMSEIKRVTQESIEDKITAKDLIGATLYDQNGENIGDIADISVKRLVPKSVKSGLKQQAQGNQQGEESDWLASDQDDQLKERAEDWEDSAKQSWNQMTQGGGEAMIFVSVGGLFGIGDDIVAVPASKLSYNEEEDRFTINASKDQVVALAEQEAAEYEAEQEDFAAWDQNEQDDYSARQEFDQQSDQGVSQVREALRNDSQLEDDTGIMVSTEQDQIVLRGVVSSQDAKDRAQEIAEEHSDMDVKNEIRVQNN